MFVSQSVVDPVGPTYGVVAMQAGPECSLHPIWKAVAGAGNQPPPLVVADLVFVPGGRLGGFVALSSVNGRRLWSFATVAQTISPMIEAAGTLVAGDLSGKLYGFYGGANPRSRPR